jgi:hypothetical protein
MTSIRIPVCYRIVSTIGVFFLVRLFRITAKLGLTAPVIGRVSAYYFVCRNGRSWQRCPVLCIAGWLRFALFQKSKIWAETGARENFLLSVDVLNNGMESSLLNSPNPSAAFNTQEDESSLVSTTTLMEIWCR